MEGISEEGTYLGTLFYLIEDIRASTTRAAVRHALEGAQKQLDKAPPEFDSVASLARQLQMLSRGGGSACYLPARRSERSWSHSSSLITKRGRPDRQARPL